MHIKCIYVCTLGVQGLVDFVGKTAEFLKAIYYCPFHATLLHQLLIPGCFISSVSIYFAETI